MEITADYIYGELRKRGYSVRKWADEHEFAARTVQECIHTYAPAAGRVPAHGTVASKIMTALQGTLGMAFYAGDQS